MPKNKKNKHKHLCKYSKKEVEANLEKISALVCDPEFISSNCARVANVKDILCHPGPL